MDSQEPLDPLVVQLRGAPLPAPLGVLAIHLWFAAWEPEGDSWTRWEVWQDADAGGMSWGHVHRNLMRVDSGVGGGRPWIEREWRGEEARRLRAVLDRPETYPYRERYRAWPGPNSNTYAAWALAEAGLQHDFGRRAVGCRYRPDGHVVSLPVLPARLRPRAARKEGKRPLEGESSPR